ncbi:MAG: NAD(P)-dependent dehydrogenase (short-subunit alcohol dehydrogenase family) [Myxococcota bacterium]|jgi:NAD(P)-dependent dehydrogenase (short-subunit alcohol dehydrogenase family)
MEIQGSIAIVTGAARGIGRATAVALAKAGARGVALVDVKQVELEEATQLVRAAGADALALAADVSDLASLESVFESVMSRWGRLDILHNNAGIGEGPGDWPAVAPERVGQIIDVNLKGVALGTRLALEPMQASGGGVVINTASGGAFIPLPPQAVYVATKAAVVHFTKSCAPLHQSHGVRVNCVCPGIVDTPMVTETGSGGAPAPWLQGVIATMKVLEPEDIADAVLELVRDETKVAEIVRIENEPATKA